MGERKRRYRSSLAALGFIQFIAVLIVIGGVGNVLFLAFTLQDAIIVARTLQNIQSAEYSLLSMQISERAFLLFEEKNQPDIIAAFEEQEQLLADTLLDIDFYYPDVADELAVFAEQTRADFNARVEGDNNVQALDTNLRRELAIDQAAATLAEEFLLLFEEAIEGGLFVRVVVTQISVLILTLFPLLALASFIAISRVTEPILRLSNAASAIGGNHYEADLLADVTPKRSSIGELATAVGRLGVLLAEREAALRDEAVQLEEQIVQTRERRLREAQQMGGTNA